MQSDWRRILAWVDANAPDLLDALEPPADRADLADAERRLSLRLPTALRTFYALQNGTTAFAVFPALDRDESAFGPLALDEIEFYEVEDEDAGKRAKRIRRRSRRGGRAADDDAADDSEFDVDPGVRPEFWNRSWIPFAAPADRGDFLMLDFAPARGGRAGQVIEWRHDSNERRLVAPSLDALLKQIADGLEAGRCEWDERLGVRLAGDA